MIHRRRRKKNNNALFGLIAILAVLLIVAVIVALSVSKKPSTPTAPTTQPATQPSQTATNTETTAPAESEEILNGWKEVDGKRYYYVDGAILTDMWKNIDGNDFYFKPNGVMATGMVEIGGVNHFFSSTGVPFIVVNPWNAVPKGYEPDLKPIPTKYAVEGMRVDASCYDALLEMLDDCNAAMNGETSACVLSSYRSMEDQTNAFQNKINRVLAANPGMSHEEATLEAATVVARPGTSEHQLGLAVDIIDEKLWALEEEQEDLPAQKWLMENCWRYGFLLRYPKNTTDSTGIIYEPWHYRYLGVDLATEIHHSGMTVEEYLDSIRS